MGEPQSPRGAPGRGDYSLASATLAI